MRVATHVKGDSVDVDRVLAGLDEEDESLILCPGIDETVIPHAQRVGVDFYALERN